eukprot:m.33324 g.33324  ORF g.33324 m.33324 type:complete len:174 (+) comp12222_c0_seq1:143-664(+)
MADVSAQEQALQQQVVALEAFVLQLQEQQSKGVVTEAEVAAEILTALIDEQIEEVAFQVHRSVKLKLTCPCPMTAEPGVVHTHQGLVDLRGFDIYGQKVSKQPPPNFNCPHCGVLRQAGKFAPHLEKCMGMGGRESRRAAAQRGRELIHQQAGNEAKVKTSRGDAGLPKRSKR